VNKSLALVSSTVLMFLLSAAARADAPTFDVTDVTSYISGSVTLGIAALALAGMVLTVMIKAYKKGKSAV